MQPQETTIAIVAIAAVVVLLLVWLFAQKRRTGTLRDHFGEEYDRTISAKGSRSEGEADLLEREKRAKDLDIRPLTGAERNRFGAQWTETRSLFVDDPIDAVHRADRLLTEIMTTRGYPMADFERRHADLTVDHGEVATHYREGHEIADRAQDATTEELRRAFNHYEALYSEMTTEDAEGDAGEADAHEPRRKPAFSTTTTRPAD